MKKKYDFAGWATKNDIKCSDGVTIKQNAFIKNDGKTVPLVWNHDHVNIDNVLGHALLVNKTEGVYAYGSFNDSETAQEVKKRVSHGDILSMSIYANKVKIDNKDVIEGDIKEVSLVLAGANPGAYVLENNFVEHGEIDTTKFILYTEPLEHKDSFEEELAPTAGTETNPDLVHKANEDEETVQDVFDTLTEKQKTAVYAIIGQLAEDYDIDVKKEEEKGDNKMKQNAFQQEGQGKTTPTVLTHGALNEMLIEAKEGNLELKSVYLEHAEKEGYDPTPTIADISALLNDGFKLVNLSSKSLNYTEWVDEVMGGITESPFKRIKSTLFDLSEDEARAKGYIKGKQKIAEIISATKRTTSPATIYKLQKLDRDDLLDIEDIDVVGFMKKEGTAKLHEEIARQIIYGDGRTGSDAINPENIRPIVSDTEVFVTKRELYTATATMDEIALRVIDDIIKNRSAIKASGAKVAFINEDLLTSVEILKDTNNHYLYDDLEVLAKRLRVSKVVPVDASIAGDNLVVIAALKQYHLGGKTLASNNFFNSFKLEFNQQQYLTEERRSGALVEPKAALILSKAAAV